MKELCHMKTTEDVWLLSCDSHYFIDQALSLNMLEHVQIRSSCLRKYFRWRNGTGLELSPTSFKCRSMDSLTRKDFKTRPQDRCLRLHEKPISSLKNKTQHRCQADPSSMDSLPASCAGSENPSRTLLCHSRIHYVLNKKKQDSGYCRILRDVATATAMTNFSSC